MFNLPDFIANSFVSVSLTEVIRKTALNAEVQVMFEELGLLTPNQADILSRLRTGQLRSLKVTDTSGKEIELVCKNQWLKSEPADALLKRILTNTYHTINAETLDGKLINVEMKSNKKFTTVSIV